MTIPRPPSSLAFMLVAGLLSGCWLTPADSAEILAYPLEVEAPASEGAPVAWQLGIEVPVARGPVAEHRIVVRDDDGAFSLLAGARWSDRTPELVQAALITSFEDAGRVTSVVRTSVGARSDYLLLVELRAFEADPRDGWSVNVVMSAKLLRMTGMRVVAGRVFRARVPAEGGAPAIVEAFREATTRVVEAMHGWVIETGERDWGRAQHDDEP